MMPRAHRFLVLCIGVIAALLAAAAPAPGSLGDDTDAEWRAYLRELNGMKDGAAARERIDEKAAELLARIAKEPTAADRIRLAQLLVQCKVSRVKMIEKGSVSVKAIELLVAAIEDEPDHIIARLTLARTCQALPEFFGRREQAREQYADLYARALEAPEAVPFPDVYHRTAEALSADDPVAALEVARRGIERFPRDRALQGVIKKLKAAVPEAPELVTGGETVSPVQAKERFWRAFESGKLQYAPLRRALAAAARERPADAELALLAGLLRLWALTTPGDETDMSRGQMATEAVAAFERALERNPDDKRIAGWLGPLKANLGRSIGDEAMAAEGEAILDKGVEAYPEQNLFGRVIADMQSLGALQGGKREARLRRITDDLYRTIELCAGQPMDRERFLVPSSAGGARPTPTACEDSVKAPHNQSGTLFWAGDFFLGVGEHRKAADAFGEALRMDAEGSWPHRALAESRRELAVLLLGGEQTAEPLPPAPSSCLLCHQKR
ncbi:MAG: hypothetical protein O7H41_04475 [Planctomycetota bacterium]|nr:hypothetical protein [Planctomycetota bacterium]